ncbi:MAG: hypothetical protein SOV66_04255 [Sodaliphilus sp.]|nr:hypothetical protein [Sodaliphilus sp.]
MKYHVPTGFGFSPKASGFYPFDDATDLASEGGGGDVVWMIQASASNHKPQTKGTVLLVCLWHIQTKRTVPLVCGLCAIVYCKNNQGCGLISTALILYDFIGNYLRRLVAERFAPERLLRSAAPRRAELPRLPRC